MQEKEELVKKEDFVKWFSDLNKDSGGIVGGKGANLAEVYNLGIPVPPGFVVTAQAYDYFIKKSGIKNKIHEILDKIDYENTKELEDATKKVREIIINSSFPKELEEEIIESYDTLGSASKIDSSRDSVASKILEQGSEPVFVAVRSSATTEDLADASFAGQQDTYVNIKGNHQLLSSIKKCFASLFTTRATYYRNKKGFKHEKSKLAVVVQVMIDSKKSGVIFSQNPSYKDDNIIIEAVFGLGEGIVSGKITPDNYLVSRDLEIKEKKQSNKKIALTRNSAGDTQIINLSQEVSNRQVLSDYEITRLAEFAIKIENHYKKPQDIEFAIENDSIYIVQARPITTMGNRVEKTQEDENKEFILKGLAASPGVASGKVKIINDLSDLNKIKKGDILVTEMTNPDMVVTMQKSSAIVTNEGGLTAHAAIVSREMGIPCIVGTDNATEVLKEGQIITVNGNNGRVYSGKTQETVKKEILPIEKKTNTKIKVIVDLPNFAERASKTGIKEIGLTRIEGIIAESGKHPEYFLKNNQIKDYEEVIFNGIEKISEYFNELWIRTSDIRTDEFRNLKGAPEEIEANPMLGFHGIRYSLKKPEILKAELNALKRVSKKGKKIGLLLPQVINVDEVKGVKKILNEIEFKDSKLGVMIETPAAVQQIKELCDEGIEFISFGTNDLTQYMLAVDRGNEEVQDIYNEMHPAILYQLSYVIRVCNRRGVETSICGQAGSKKEMVKYLVEKGIKSISVNADVAKEISDYIYDLETKADYENEDEVKDKQELGKNEDEQKSEINNNEEESEYTDNEDEDKKGNEINNNEKKSNEDEVNQENINKDIQAIEKEKQEYLEQNNKEIEKPEEDINKEKVQEYVNEFEKESNEQESEVNNEKESNENEVNQENIDKDIQAIEKEKQEYLEKDNKEGQDSTQKSVNIF
ncbi:MAG: phosphoenolpyruvate synthase [Minisyncoccales bacterium]